MKTVVMKYGVSGGRADGTGWPAAGEKLECDDREAAELVAGGLADWAEDEPADAEPEPVTAAPGVPSVRAAKEDWVAHAVAQGADPGEAAAATKADLVASYGKGNGN